VVAKWRYADEEEQMPVSTSYPGVYIEELPSLVHSITPAPTSIAVFIGYTHPFRTKQFGTAVQLSSAADYQSNFGGFFSCPWQPDYVGQAVSQFFLNGGQTCYVVGLHAKQYYDPLSSPPGHLVGSVAPAGITAGSHSQGITFTAVQPVGVTANGATAGISMNVVVSNPQSSTPSNANDIADIVISYGTTVETYRKVPIGDLITTLGSSNLVTVTLSSPPPTAYTPGNFPLGYGSLASPNVAPLARYTVISPTDFAPVFAEFASLDKVPVFNLLAIPGISDPTVTAEAAAYCERKRAFYIVDTPSPVTAGWDVNSIVGQIGQSAALTPAAPLSTNAAVYYPWLQTSDPLTAAKILAPPSGYVAGVYGREDNAHGVWKSPAGIETTLLGTTGVAPSGVMTDPQQGTLNQNAINCLRHFPGVGAPVVFGARTTAGSDTNTAQQQWKYVAVRRMALFIEQTLYSQLNWAVFEGNDTPLWNALTQEVNAFMLSLFRQGAFAGSKPSQAFVVQCDSTTTTATDQLNGVVNILVGFAPLVPAEFVVVKIAQLAGQAQS
jgi:phage tail sheath protein FI